MQIHCFLLYILELDMLLEVLVMNTLIVEISRKLKNLLAGTSHVSIGIFSWLEDVIECQDLVGRG